MSSSPAFLPVANANIAAEVYSHCTTGGWILGNEIDGTQAEYVRTPHADTRLYHIPADADEEALVMLSDILPTGFECGVLNGKVAPGSTVPIVGAGPIGLAALLTAQFYSPAELIMIDVDDKRLKIARIFGATHTINSASGKAADKVKALTDGKGVDTAIEAVGVPATFVLFARISSLPGASSQTSECTAARSICTCRDYGRTISQLRPGWSTRSRRRCFSRRYDQTGSSLPN